MQKKFAAAVQKTCKNFFLRYIGSGETTGEKHMMDQPMHEARWWTPAENGAVRCGLCPRRCAVPPGRTGFCGVRKNADGRLFSLAYGYPAALQVDPIEKKPLRHFLPGTKVFSVGTFGCNLGCVFCQNDHLSRGSYNPRSRYRYFSPSELVELAFRHKCRSIAFTYNEPTVWAEYVIDTFRIAKEKGLGTVLVSNAYLSREAAEELFPLTDAANFDVKGFSDDFYGPMCGGTLQPVLDSCRHFRCELGKHLEITNLVIPGKNSSPEQIAALLDWIERTTGLDTPVHFSAYFPAYKYHESPRTPASLLRDIQAEAVMRGFTRVYLGNI